MIGGRESESFGRDGEIIDVSGMTQCPIPAPYPYSEVGAFGAYFPEWDIVMVCGGDDSVS